MPNTTLLLPLTYKMKIVVLILHKSGCFLFQSSEIIWWMSISFVYILLYICWNEEKLILKNLTYFYQQYPVILSPVKSHDQNWVENEGHTSKSPHILLAIELNSWFLPCHQCSKWDTPPPSRRSEESKPNSKMHSNCSSHYSGELAPSQAISIKIYNFLRLSFCHGFSFIHKFTSHTIEFWLMTGLRDS